MPIILVCDKCEVSMESCSCKVKNLQPQFVLQGNTFVREDAPAPRPNPYIFGQWGGIPDSERRAMLWQDWSI
jgi:hypothetical protein